jgi:hypothetical protein
MKRFLFTFVFFMFVFATCAFAAWYNPISWIKAGLAAGGWNAVAWILTALLGLAVFGTVMVVRIINTLKEAGELLIALSDALSDRKVTPEEIKTITDDIRDVMNVWKTTPEAYTKPPEAEHG